MNDRRCYTCNRHLDDGELRICDLQGNNFCITCSDKQEFLAYTSITRGTINALRERINALETRLEILENLTNSR